MIRPVPDHDDDEVDGHGADDDVVAVFFDAFEFSNLAQVDQLFWLHQALLHRGQQGLSTSQCLATSFDEFGGVRGGGGAFVGKCVHINSF